MQYFCFCETKPRRGRQRKAWGRVVDEFFTFLGWDRQEWVEDIKRGKRSLACLYGREWVVEEGLNSKVKNMFGKEVKFKRYLHGVGDAGTRLLFKFRSGTHGLNEEVGRYRGREGKSECTLCGAECESVVHVWDCSAYSNIRVIFVEKLLEDRHVNFDKLNSIEKTVYVLGSELWEYDFSCVYTTLLIRISIRISLIRITCKRMNPDYNPDQLILLKEVD